MSSAMSRTRAMSQWFGWGALALLVGVVVAVLIKQNYFSQSTTLYFFSGNGQGLNVGMAVKLAGFKVGSVENISIDSQARVKVAMSLSNDYIQLVSKDAKARLIKEGLIGESVVEIVPVEGSKRSVAQHDVLVFERALDIAELAEKLVDQVMPILEDVKKITAALGDADQDIRQSMKNVQQISAELNKTSQKINSLTADSMRTMELVHHSTGLVDSALPGMLSSVQENLTNLQETTAQIRKMTTPRTGSIPVILNNSDKMIRDGKDILGAAKESWPVSSMLPEVKPRMLQPDAYVEPRVER